LLYKLYKRSKLLINFAFLDPATAQFLDQIDYLIQFGGHFLKLGSCLRIP
jgi:hypothetical protein